jgi:hypothetical protein
MTVFEKFLNYLLTKIGYRGAKMSPIVNLKGSGDIRIIGPQASGKTTYMAALAYWPNAKPSSSPIQNIEAADLGATQNLILNPCRQLDETSRFFTM